jgi:hypothetical protein
VGHGRRAQQQPNLTAQREAIKKLEFLVGKASSSSGMGAGGWWTERAANANLQAASTRWRRLR